MDTRYYGDIIINPNMDWISSSNFSTNVLYDDVDIDVELGIPNEVLTMWRIPVDTPYANNFKEWQVMRNGQWMDSVYFDCALDSADVHRVLTEGDSYPTDIIVLPAAAKEEGDANAKRTKRKRSR